MLKIDKIFVDGIADGTEAAALANAIVELGRALDLQVVAEGVELADQFALLREMGCDLGQGYYWAKPMPNAAAWDVLNRGRELGAIADAVDSPIREDESHSPQLEQAAASAATTDTDGESLARGPVAAPPPVGKLHGRPDSAQSTRRAPPSVEKTARRRRAQRHRWLSSRGDDGGLAPGTSADSRRRGVWPDWSTLAAVRDNQTKLAGVGNEIYTYYRPAAV